MKVLWSTGMRTTGSTRWTIRLERKPQDAWVGAAWRTLRGAKPVLDLWVCVVPFFPIHVFIQRTVAR